MEQKGGGELWGGGKTDVAGANRLNIFQPRWNGTVEVVAMLLDEKGSGKFGARLQLSPLSSGLE